MKHFLKITLITTAVISLTAIVQSCTDGKANTDSIPKKTESIPVKVLRPERSSDQIIIKASGRLTTDDEAVLSFKTAGIVNAVLVKEGDQVKRGQVLATLNLTETNALVAQARHNYEKAQRDFQRVTNLYKDSVATLEQLQNAGTGLAVATEQLEVADYNRSFSQIYAPANGYVLQKFVNPGQVVGTGDPVLMTNGAIGSKWILKIGVSDRQWASIDVNGKAGVRIDAFPSREFKAVVIRKSGASDPQTGAFTIDLLVRHPDAKFANGMFGSADVTSARPQASWSIPYEAVLDANANEGFVFVTNDFKTAIRQPVVIESFDGTAIRISKGLEDAGALIVSGSAYLSDSSSITVVK
jgi:RND family efflux transporter MFP subunit